MQFEINLGRIERFPELPLQYEEELDDVRSILSDICEALADTSSADFIISGFGQERWPVDVRTDLPVFLEQLPKALTSVELGSSFSLDFYEQGVERVIHFECTGEEYSARCESQTDWTPRPAIETIGRLELKKMFSDVRHSIEWEQWVEAQRPRVNSGHWRVRSLMAMLRDTEFLPEMLRKRTLSRQRSCAQETGSSLAQRRPLVRTRAEVWRWSSLLEV